MQDIQCCVRCGQCCRNMIAIVPKYETSNLSPEFLETFFDFEQQIKYVEEHSEFQGEKCKWLDDSNLLQCKCNAYERRGSDCRNYPEGKCKVGPHVMRMRKLLTLCETCVYYDSSFQRTYPAIWCAKELNKVTCDIDCSLLQDYLESELNGKSNANKTK